MNYPQQMEYDSQILSKKIFAYVYSEIVESHVQYHNYLIVSTKKQALRKKEINILFLVNF